MSESQRIDENDPVLGTDFGLEMVRQMRALDAYGTYDQLSAAKILEPFVLTKEQKREIPVVGEPNRATLARINAFYNAIAVLIEKECGLLATPLVNLSPEGFGRVLITVGKLVVMDRPLRDAHRFSFASLSKMKDDADTILAIALDIIGQHPKVAGM